MIDAEQQLRQFIEAVEETIQTKPRGRGAVDIDRELQQMVEMVIQEASYYEAEADVGFASVLAGAVGICAYLGV